MVITRTNQRMTIRSLEQVKLSMSLIATGIGALMAIYLRPFNWMLVLFSLIFVIVGIMLGFDIGYTKAVLNKSGKSSINTRRGRRTSATSFLMDDIQYIEKLEYVMGGGWNGPKDILQLVVKGQDNFEIAATQQNNLLLRLIPSLRPYRRQGKKIAIFANKEYRLKSVNPLKEFKKSLSS
jgi:uncharacterized membrane protein